MRFETRYAELLHRAAEFPDAPDPLRAELAVSGLLGSAWSLAASGEHQALREGLVAFLSERPGRPALALLRIAATMGSPAERAVAGQAADTLAATGVAEPAWTTPPGQVRAGRCWVYGDVFGDQESVVTTFHHTGPTRPAPATRTGETGMGDRSSQDAKPAIQPEPANPHALVVLVDHNLGGIIKDIFCTAHADRTLRAIARANAADGPMSVLEPITAGQARTRLERAFAACRAAWEPPVGDNARALWALATSRLAALPEGPPPTSPDRYDAAARAAIVQEFLTAPQARTLSDRDASAACARLIVDHGCDYDGGNPLRISPAKTELFLLYWLPRQPELTSEQTAAMPAVAEAWVRWVASGQRLSGQPLTEVVAAVRECGARFLAR